jgi:hypothetical protein
MIEYIHSVYGGDHGRGKFRFPTKLVIKCKGSNEPFPRTYLFAEIDCKKDNGEIIKSTIPPEIQSGTDKVLTRSFKFIRAHVKNKWVWVAQSINDADVDPGDKDVIKPKAFLCGDLAFLFMVLGREDYSGWWCYICDLYKDQWQDLDHHRLGNLWTLDALREQHRHNVENNVKGAAMKGVREDPIFNFPIDQIIWPLLHSNNGIGNGGLNFVIDYTELYIQCLSEKEIKLRKDVVALKQKIAVAQAAKESWEAEGKSKLVLLENEF